MIGARFTQVYNVASNYSGCPGCVPLPGPGLGVTQGSALTWFPIAPPLPPLKADSSNRLSLGKPTTNLVSVSLRRKLELNWEHWWWE